MSSILRPNPSIILMSLFGGSIAPALLEGPSAAAGPDPDEPWLTAETFWNTRTGAPGFGTTASLGFQIDGSLTYTDGTSTPIDKSGEWYSTEPVADIGDDYDVRCASITSGPAWFAEGAAVGTWIDISNGGVGKTWQVNRQYSVDGNGTTETVGVFEIRATGTGPVLATASFTGQAILT